MQDIRLRDTKGGKDLYYVARQEDSYVRTLKDFEKEFDWILFVDSDEYLFLSKDTVKTFLLRLSGADSVAVHWCCYGSSGHVLTPVELPVEAFTKHGLPAQHINKHVKSFVRPLAWRGRYHNVHAFDVDPEKLVGTDGKKILWSDIIGLTQSEADWSIAKIMHYQCKSMEQFIGRVRLRPELPSHVSYFFEIDFSGRRSIIPKEIILRVKLQMKKY